LQDVSVWAASLDASPAVPDPLPPPLPEAPASDKGRPLPELLLPPAPPPPPLPLPPLLLLLAPPLLLPERPPSGRIILPLPEPPASEAPELDPPEEVSPQGALQLDTAQFVNARKSVDPLG
jgi:hypothetical protein